MIDRLSGLIEFVAVVDEGGFSSAARRLGVSKSVVSQRVGQLEARLGTRLLMRSTRAVSLTEAGETFLGGCREALGSLEQAESAARATSDEPQGCVRLSCTADFAADHVAPLLPLLRHAHPRLEVELRVSDSYVDLVSEGLDLAIRYGPLTTESMVMRRLGPQRGVFVASPSYIERRGMPTDPEDLAEHDCLIFTPFPWGTQWRFVHERRGARDVRVRAALHSNSGLVLRCAAVAGTGVALLATLLASPAILDGSLVTVLPGWQPRVDATPRAVFAVYPDNRFVPPKVRVLVDALARRFGDPPHWDAMI